MQVGTIYRADGTTERVIPANRREFTLAELQRAVGGFIELVRMAKGNGHGTMLINEEGKLKGLPHNEAASTLLSPHYCDHVVGDAIVIRQEKQASKSDE